MNQQEQDFALTCQLLTRHDLERILQVSANTIERMVNRGMLPAPIFFSKRMRRWRPEDIMSALERRDSVTP